jgi:hypothetical protein
MKHVRRFTGLVLALASLCAGARAQTLDRAPGESDLAFATRALRLPKDADPHTTLATWNGAPTLFVDYTTAEAEPERPLVALQRRPKGGTPDILAIGFANADRDADRELIVILAWSQVHYDFSVTLYEVRLFDAPKPGQAQLTLLPVSGKFGVGCECGRRDGPDEHYRFKTVAAVKAELKRLGY